MWHTAPLQKLQYHCPSAEWSKRDKQTITVVRAVASALQGASTCFPDYAPFVLKRLSFPEWGIENAALLLSTLIIFSLIHGQILPFVFIFPRELLSTTLPAFPLLPAPQSALIYGSEREKNTHKSLQNVTYIGAPTSVQPNCFVSAAHIQLKLVALAEYIWIPANATVRGKRMWCGTD